MRKEKFVYNTHTLRYEKVEESLSTKLIRVFGFICAAIFTAFLFTIIIYRYFPSPTERIQAQRIEQLTEEISKMSSDMDQFSQQLEYLQDKDAYAYRMVFGMDPIDDDVIEGGVGGHDEFGEWRNDISHEWCQRL